MPRGWLFVELREVIWWIVVVNAVHIILFLFLHIYNNTIIKVSSSFYSYSCYHLLTACNTKSCNGSCGILTNSLCAVLWTHKFHRFCRDVYMCLNQQKTAVLSDFYHSGFEVSSAGFVLLKWKSIYAFRRVRTKSFKKCIMHCWYPELTEELQHLSLSPFLKLYFYLFLLFSKVTDVVCNLCRVWLTRTVRSGRR